MKYVNGEPMSAKAQLRALIKKRLDNHLEDNHAAAVILLDLAPAIACLEAGHPCLPKWRLRRYQNVAWTFARADDPVTYP